MGKHLNYWLIKTEPSTWSWTQQLQQKQTSWDGVRNYQAANNMKKMKIDDLCFFYHSVKEKSIVGIVKIVKLYYPDPTDMTKRFGMVDVKTVKSLNIPVTLNQIKLTPKLQEIALVKQSRLSVMPISYDAWQTILKMSSTVL